MSSFFDRMIEREIDIANDHLPKTRPTMREILETGDSTYETRGGERSLIRNQEIQELLKEIPPEFHNQIQLPIVILRRMDLGSGIYTIAGSRAELFLVHRVISAAVGQVNLAWSELMDWKPIEKIVRPEVQIVRKRYPSATVIGFTTIVDNNGQ